MRFFKMHLYFSLFILIAGLFGACNSLEQSRFSREDGEGSGFVFYNEIREDSMYNALDFTNLYTGSGVGIGDINQDGLPDIFMGACMNSSKLFLNKGGMKFEDVSEQMGIETDRWITGVAMVDINQDSWLDIYLSVSGPPGAPRENLLFINQEGKSFREAAASYGINDSAQCTHSSFFDYDKDGDLDLYLAVNPTDYTIFNVNTIRKRKLNGEAASTDKLYRNNGDGSFTDVSREAGVLVEGYSLGLHVSDFNGDHWPDVYVTNDFLSNDILYINQQDGSFKNEAAEYFKHTSFASMGIDVADLNNDALPEIYVLDMFPEDNYRQKMLMPGTDYNRFEYILKAGYEPQYSRNTLQLNNGDESFSEIGQMANLHKTDWSWSALLADFDNDGLKDVFVGNGFLRDMGDLDYIAYNKSQPFGSREMIRKRQLELIRKQKSIKIPNYMFRNLGDMNFSKEIGSWGFQDSTCSNGAAYADLDLDGDLDLVVNNLNQASYLYENHSRQMDGGHYLKLQLKGEAPNWQAIGAKLYLHTEDQILFQEMNPYRGYESSVDDVIHMGLGKIEKIDSLVVIWPDMGKTVWTDLKPDSLYQLSPKGKNSFTENPAQEEALFAKAKSLNYRHTEDHHVDFYYQDLLPHQFNQMGPAIAAADLNGDTREDLFVGGAAGTTSKIYLQEENGEYREQELSDEKIYEDVDALFFDADQDGDQDLYVVSGGSVYSNKTEVYQDRLYINDGKGNFKREKAALPAMLMSTSCVRAGDYDSDGDLDLFVGGRLMPGKYPSIPRSYLLENEGGKFKDVSEEKAAELSHAGMITDASWEDLDGDGKVELITVGEWSPISIYRNTGQGLEVWQTQGLEKSSGWWNSLKAGDFDGDGDMDFLAGNLGLNTNYRASSEQPLCLYAKDYDQNGSIDPVMCQFINGVEYPIASRDKLIKQLPYLEANFSNYRSYAMANFSQVFDEKSLEEAQILRAYTLASSYVENLGGGKFRIKPLARILQTAPINDIWVEDIDKDGALDALLVGNSYATEVKTGRYDAFTGAFLKGNGKGDFEIMRGGESGFLADKDARKVLRHVNAAKNIPVYVVANNADSLQLFYHTANSNNGYNLE